MFSWMFSYLLDEWIDGQSDCLRKKAESVKDRVVEIRKDLQSALNRTKRIIDTFAKLQKSEAQYFQYQRRIRTSDLKNGIENLLFELDTNERRDMSYLKFNIADLLFELDTNERRDMSESEKDALLTELDRSKSELDAFEKDRNAMYEALKQTRRDIYRENMQELLVQEEKAIATSAKLKSDKEVLRFVIYAKTYGMDDDEDEDIKSMFTPDLKKDIDFLRDKLWRKDKAIDDDEDENFKSMFTPYLEKGIDVLRDELRHKNKAIAILENYIAVLQFELRRTTDMYDGEYEDVGSIFTRSEWSTRYDRALAYRHPFELLNDWRAMRVKLHRTMKRQDKLVKDLEGSQMGLDRSRRLQKKLTKDLKAVQVDIDQTRRLQAKLENVQNSILAPFQIRSGIDKLLYNLVVVRVNIDQTRRLQAELERKKEDLLDASNHSRRYIDDDQYEDVVSIFTRFPLLVLEDMQFNLDRTWKDIETGCEIVFFGGMVVFSVSAVAGLPAVCARMAVGGKPTTSKEDVQRFKTSVSFGGMSTEVLERQNYKKQSREEKEEEEEEEFRAVEQMLMCKVCLDEDLSIVFLPCRHMATCERCASVLDNCPVCRSPINESLKVNYE